MIRTTCELIAIACLLLFHWSAVRQGHDLSERIQRLERMQASPPPSEAVIIPAVGDTSAEALSTEMWPPCRALCRPPTCPAHQLTISVVED